MSERGYLIGLTGTLGSGKSTALQLFEKESWSCLSADRLVHETLSTDSEVYDLLLARWGSEILEDGKLARSRIAQIIFSDKEELSFLENLLHPRVREKWQSAVQADPQRNWMIEVPLLFEKDLDPLFDASINVSISAKGQLERAKSRNGSQAFLEERIAQQMTNEEKNERATYVLSNEGSIDFLEKQVKALAQRFAN